MEKNVYNLIYELSGQIGADKVLTTSDVAGIKATLHTLLVVYAPEDATVNKSLDGPSEARKPPTHKAKSKFWGIFG